MENDWGWHPTLSSGLYMHAHMCTYTKQPPPHMTERGEILPSIKLLNSCEAVKLVAIAYLEYNQVFPPSLHCLLLPLLSPPLSKLPIISESRGGGHDYLGHGQPFPGGLWVLPSLLGLASKGPDTKPRHSLGKMARSDHGDKLPFIILLPLSFLNVILAIINQSE